MSVYQDLREELIFNQYITEDDELIFDDFIIVNEIKYCVYHIKDLHIILKTTLNGSLNRMIVYRGITLDMLPDILSGKNDDVIKIEDKRI